jgi:putative NADH-flavin reductase
MRRSIVTSLCSFLVAGPCAAEPLEILVYGATGKIGSQAVVEALDRGHRVTAVSRDPSQIELRHENLTAAKGDLLDLDSIRELAVGRDVVIVSVRGVIGRSKTPESALQYIAARNVVEALREIGGAAPRLIHVGGSGSLEVEPGVLYADKLPKLFLPKKMELEVSGQVLAL